MHAEITPAGLENPGFATKMRGYDPDEVDAFLAQVAATLRQHKDTAERAYQVVGEELGDLLQQARDRADAMLAAAEKEAAKVTTAAEKEATEVTAAAAEAAEKTREKAAKAAARTRREAEEESTRVRAEAETAASETRKAADEDALRTRTEAAEAAEQLRVASEKDAEERTARADEVVRQLEAKEAAARERVSTLRAQLAGLATQLEALEDGPAGTAGEAVATVAELPAEQEPETENIRLKTRAGEPAGQTP